MKAKERVHIKQVRVKEMQDEINTKKRERKKGTEKNMKANNGLRKSQSWATAMMSK